MGLLATTVTAFKTYRFTEEDYRSRFVLHDISEGDDEEGELAAGLRPNRYAVVAVDRALYRSILVPIFLQYQGVRKHRWGIVRSHNGKFMVLAPAHGSWPWQKGEFAKEDVLTESLGSEDISFGAPLELFTMSLLACVRDETSAYALDEIARMGSLSVDTMRVVLYAYAMQLGVDDCRGLPIEQELFLRECSLLDIQLGYRKTKAPMVSY